MCFRYLSCEKNENKLKKAHLKNSFETYVPLPLIPELTMLAARSWPGAAPEMALTRSEKNGESVTLFVVGIDMNLVALSS